MKNKHYERMIKSSKQATKKWKSAGMHSHVDGIVTKQFFDSVVSNFGYWEDIDLVIGSQRYVIAWQHPRMAFEETVGSIARDMAQHTFPKHKQIGEKIYKTVGKRKRVIAMRYNSNDDHFNEWIRALGNAREIVYQTTDTTITPYIFIKQVPYGKFVDVCIPYEAVDYDSVIELAKIVRSLILRETTIDALYPNYTYTKDTWKEEGQK